ncbi:sulfhydryl oxidase 2 [Latimeria chalumnae]|uniref:sulfhydryl oxidase 2 n=1 Tax=Latimeria chalumnae TaxID=7897 RepID=UPI00313C89EE
MASCRNSKSCFSILSGGLRRGFFLVSLLEVLCQARAGKLYSSQDSVVILDSKTIKKALLNSSSAWVLEFYSSWCGHCINYAPTWKALASDVKDWEPAIKIGVLDCAEETNYELCKEYDIRFYPSFRYFKAFSTQFTTGEDYKGSDRELETVRQMLIDFLQNHTQQNKPPPCPSLEPLRSSDDISLLDKNLHIHTAIIIENESSYVGREVILDLMQYEHIVVRRALDSNKVFLDKLGITSSPSCYLINSNGSHGLINIQHPLRSYLSSYLKSLPGVKRKLLSQENVAIKHHKEENNAIETWKTLDRSLLYMSDLESGLHYLLRVELASHKTLEGAELKTFKDFTILIAKLFPGRQPVVKLLETLQEWLVSLPLDKIPYNAILDLVNNKMRISGMFLSNRIQWVGCQGSRQQLRGYPCSLWTLFHTLTVQAAIRPEALRNTGFEDNPRVVLQIMRRYIQHFFGCRECAQHFEEMAEESMDSVKTVDEAILWLWKKHNAVNKRLAGAPSEDPEFPKVQWPTPDFCPACHKSIKGLHTWNEDEVLKFLKRHYSTENISYKYTVEEEKDSDMLNAHENEEIDKVPPQKKMESREIVEKDPQTLFNSKLAVLGKSKTHNGPSLKAGIKADGALHVHEEAKQSVMFFGIGFSNIDMSLCVLLYVASCLFLMIMFFFFRMRSKRWKFKHTRSHV